MKDTSETYACPESMDGVLSLVVGPTTVGETIRSGTGSHHPALVGA